jgi:hypothetical protein
MPLTFEHLCDKAFDYRQLVRFVVSPACYAVPILTDAMHIGRSVSMYGVLEYILKICTVTDTL